MGAGSQETSTCEILRQPRVYKKFPSEVVLTKVVVMKMMIDGSDDDSEGGNDDDYHGDDNRNGNDYHNYIDEDDGDGKDYLVVVTMVVTMVMMMMMVVINKTIKGGVSDSYHRQQSQFPLLWWVLVPSFSCSAMPRYHNADNYGPTKNMADGYPSPAEQRPNGITQCNRNRRRALRMYL